jgi:CTP-dependent riboflavin kinase
MHGNGGVVAGVVTTGTKRTAGMMKEVPDIEWLYTLGVVPVPGDLNLWVGEEDRGWLFERRNGTGFLRARVDGVVGWIRFGPSKDTVEVLSDSHLRQSLGLRDGDCVRIIAT